MAGDILNHVPDLHWRCLTHQNVQTKGWRSLCVRRLGSQSMEELEGKNEGPHEETEAERVKKLEEHVLALLLLFRLKN